MALRTDVVRLESMMTTRRTRSFAALAAASALALSACGGDSDTEGMRELGQGRGDHAVAEGDHEARRHHHPDLAGDAHLRRTGRCVGNGFGHGAGNYAFA